MPVSARFHTLRNELLAEVDEVFAEKIKFCFLKNGREDPSRSSYYCEAILRTMDGKTKQMSTATSSWNVQVSAEKSTLNINKNIYCGPDIRVGDKICAITRDGEPFFEVLSVDDRSHRRFILEIGIV